MLFRYDFLKNLECRNVGIFCNLEKDRMWVRENPYVYKIGEKGDTTKLIPNYGDWKWIIDIGFLLKSISVVDEFLNSLK